MHSETFYKIGGALQFLTVFFMIFQGTDISEFVNVTTEIVDNEFNGILDLFPEEIRGNYWMYMLFLVNASFVNLLIARSGMPIELYRSFILINIGTWSLAVLINSLYLPIICTAFHTLILLAFILAFFTKPKFQ